MPELWRASEPLVGRELNLLDSSVAEKAALAVLDDGFDLDLGLPDDTSLTPSSPNGATPTLEPQPGAASSSDLASEEAALIAQLQAVRAAMRGNQ